MHTLFIYEQSFAELLVDATRNAHTDELHILFLLAGHRFVNTLLHITCSHKFYSLSTPRILEGGYKNQNKGYVEALCFGLVLPMVPAASIKTM